MKGIIYYTDNKLKDPLFSIVQDLLLKTELPIVSCSLKPIEFGKNIVVNGPRGYVSYINQIITALINNDAKYVFFCEHDVLYPNHILILSRQEMIYFIIIRMCGGGGVKAKQ